MKLFILITATALLSISSGCRSSYITYSWKDEKAVPVALKKVLVLALIKDNDRSLQQQMENEMAGQLVKLGYNTITSLALFGPKVFDGDTEKEALAKLSTHEIDGVFTIVLLNKTKEKEYVQNGPRQQSFWNYYGQINNRISNSGYWVTNTSYFWESNLYDLNNNSLRYSVQTQSFNPSSAATLGHEYGNMIVKDMSARNVGEKVQPAKKGF